MSWLPNAKCLMPCEGSQSSRLLLLRHNYQVAIPTSSLVGLCSLYGVAGNIASHASLYMTINLSHCPLIRHKLCWKGLFKTEMGEWGEYLKTDRCAQSDGERSQVRVGGLKRCVCVCVREDERKTRTQGLDWRDRNSPVHERLRNRHRDTAACSGQSAGCKGFDCRNLFISRNQTLTY